MRTAKSSFMADLKTALNADGIYLRPPVLDPSIKTGGFKSFGIVPVGLRGLVALHYSTIGALTAKAKEVESRSVRCDAGDCDCGKGIDLFAVLKDVEDIVGKLAKIDMLLVDELKASLGGLDIGKTPYQVAGDWSIMAPADALKKQSTDDILDMGDLDIFELIERDFGASRRGSPLDGLKDLMGSDWPLDGVLGRAGARMRVVDLKANIDLRALIGMSKDQVKAHIRAKLLANKAPSDVLMQLEQTGKLDEIADDLIKQVERLSRSPAGRRERAHAHA